MYLVDRLIEDKGGDVIVALTSVGFRPEQAEWFLCEAGDSLATAIYCARDVHDTESVLNAVDVVTLSENACLESGVVTKGLTILIPYLLEKMGGNGLQALSGTILKTNH